MHDDSPYFTEQKCQLCLTFYASCHATKKKTQMLEKMAVRCPSQFAKALCPSSIRNSVNNPDGRVVTANYVCM